MKISCNYISANLTEVIVFPLKNGQESLAQHFEYVLSKTEELTIIDVNAEIARQAAELRAKFLMRTPDAIQIAMAMSVGADYIFTNDNEFRKISKPKVLFPNEL